VTSVQCATPIDSAVLLAWWLGELDGAAADELETHLLECSACARRLEGIVEVGTAIKGCFARGATAAVLSASFVSRLAAAGMRVREYRVPCNGTVQCTLAPDDDLTVAHLQAALAGVERLDVVHLRPGHADERLEDVPFDPRAGEVVVAPHTQALRHSGDHITRMRLIDAGASPRVIGEYEFVHSAWRQA
jgi:hypothetical protein